MEKPCNCTSLGKLVSDYRPLPLQFCTLNIVYTTSKWSVLNCWFRFMDGLSCLGVLEGLRSRNLLYDSFCYKAPELTASDVTKIFQPKFALEGSDRCREEHITYSYWLDILIDYQGILWIQHTWNVYDMWVLIVKIYTLCPQGGLSVPSLKLTLENWAKCLKDHLIWIGYKNSFCQ